MKEFLQKYIPHPSEYNLYDTDLQNKKTYGFMQYSF